MIAIVIVLVLVYEEEYRLILNVYRKKVFVVCIMFNI